MYKAIFVVLAIFLTGCVSTGRDLGASLARRGDGEGTLAEVFERVHASVVTIQIVQRTGEMDPRTGPVSAGGIGSGALISLDGKIMTAAHVVQVADSVSVVFADGSTRKARVIGSDPVGDVALLQLIDPPPMAPSWPS